MYRSGRIKHVRKLKEGNDVYERDQNGNFINDIDNCVPLSLYCAPKYTFEFSLDYELNIHEREEKDDTVEYLGYDVTDTVFETIVNDFTTQLAQCMRYKNIDILLKHNVNPGMIFLDTDEYEKVMEEYEKNRFKKVRNKKIKNII
jgi:hypothetical protein